MAASESTPQAIDVLAEEFVTRLRQGERPAVSDYEARFPEQAAEIRALFPALVVMETLKPASSPPADQPADSSSPVGTLTRLGDFRIVREIGRGGMGVVYEAVQESLGRKVALKVLPKQLVGDPARQARFEREARAAGRLHHTNIVPVFGVGDEQGLHFYAMQYIHGLGLDDVLRELQQLGDSSSKQAAEPAACLPSAENLTAGHDIGLTITQALRTGRFERPDAEIADPPPDVQCVASRARDTSGSRDTQGKRSSPSLRWSDSLALPGGPGAAKSGSGRPSYYLSVARIGLQVSEALHYAHEQGVLHRDIKPSNLLLDTRGTIWVTDFGLAKADDQADLTQSGDVLGTLRYMAPEMFQGQTDRRSDVYSLGLTLYELLALRPAFDESDRGRLIRLVLNEAPPRLRTLDPAIPMDLETIIHKAIDREPAQRYVSAQELADDLRRYLDDEPIHARRTSLATRVGRWCRRNPTIASLSAAVALLLVTATVVSAIAAGRFRKLAADRQLAIEDLTTAQAEVKSQAERAARAFEVAEEQRRRAEENLTRTRHAVDTYLNNVTDDELLAAPGLQPLRQQLLREALEFYGELAREKSHDSGLDREQATVLIRLSQIHDELGDTRSGAQARGQAISLLEHLRERLPDDGPVASMLAEAYLHGGRSRDAIRLCQQLLNHSPTSVDGRRILSDAYHELARLEAIRGEHLKSLEYYQLAMPLRRQLADEFPDDAKLVGSLASTINNLGVALREQGKMLEALEMYQLAATYGERACQLDPRSLRWAQARALFIRNVAYQLRIAGQHQEALAAFEQLVDLRRRLVFENPAASALRGELYRDLVSLSDQQQQLGLQVEARRSMRDARDGLRQLRDGNTDDLVLLALVYAGLADPHSANLPPDTSAADAEDERQRNADLALQTLQEAARQGWADVNLLKNHVALAPLRTRQDFQEFTNLIESQVNARELFSGSGQATSNTLASQQRAVEILNRRLSERPREIDSRRALATTYHSLGLVQTGLKQFDEAERSLTLALDTFVSMRGESPDNADITLAWVGCRADLGHLYWQLRRFPEAHHIWQDVLTQAERLSQDRSLVNRAGARLAQIEYRICHTYFRLGLWDQAARYARQNAVLGRADLSREQARFATLLSQHVDVERHREYCRVLAAACLKKGANGLAMYPADLIWVSSQCPRPPDELARWIRLLEEIVAKSPPDAWRNEALAFGCTRLGRHADALRLLKASGHQYVDLPDRALLMALSLQALGQHDEARRWLTRAESGYQRLMSEWYSSLTPDEYEMPMERWQLPAFRALRDDAWQHVLGQSPPADVWLPLIEARAYALVGEVPRSDESLAAATAALSLGQRDLVGWLAPIDRGLALDRLQGHVTVGVARWRLRQYAAAHEVWQTCLREATQLAEANRDAREYQRRLSDVERVPADLYARLGLPLFARELAARNVHFDRVGALGTPMIASDGELSAVLLGPEQRPLARQFLRKFLVASREISDDYFGEFGHLVRGAAFLGMTEELAAPEMQRPLSLMNAHRHLPWVAVGAALVEYQQERYADAAAILRPYRDTTSMQEAFLDSAIAAKLGDHERALERFRQAHAHYVAESQQALVAEPADDGRGIYPVHWWQFYFAQALRRLAASELRAGFASDDDPWSRLIEARGWLLIGERSRAERELTAAAATAADDPGVNLARERLRAQF